MIQESVWVGFVASHLIMTLLELKFSHLKDFFDLKRTKWGQKEDRRKFSLEKDQKIFF